MSETEAAIIDANQEAWAQKEVTELWAKYTALRANSRYGDPGEGERCRYQALFTLIHRGLLYADLDYDEDAAVVLKSANQRTASDAEREAFRLL